MSEIKISRIYLRSKHYFYIEESDWSLAYLLCKDGKFHDDTGYFSAYENEMDLSPGYWKTKKEAEQFLKEWPEKYPEEFAKYVARRMGITNA